MKLITKSSDADATVLEFYTNLGHGVGVFRFELSEDAAVGLRLGDAVWQIHLVVDRSDGNGLVGAAVCRIAKAIGPVVNY